MNYGGLFDLSRKEKEISVLDEEINSNGFWQKDSAYTQITAKKAANAKKFVEPFLKTKTNLDDIQEIYDLAASEKDLSLLQDLTVQLSAWDESFESLEDNLMLAGKDDQADAYLTVHSGAGGTEACDWAEMLYHMYLRWCEAKEYSVFILDYQPGGEAGIKSATIEIKGEFAYGYLKAEQGVHRLVRISPFDSNKRRHTSFASIDVIPVSGADVEIEILDKDLRVDTYRSSGAGGQHVNKTDSAIRITHLPTGSVVQCQNQRSQHQNRDTAMKMLKAKLYQLEEEKKRKEQQEREGQKMKIEWGSQIRSYVFHPYIMVKDHRTNIETGNGDAVMEGSIDQFILGYLKKFKGQLIG